MTEEKKGNWWRKYTKRHISDEPMEAQKAEGPKTAVVRKPQPVEHTDPYVELETMQSQIDSVFRDLFSRDVFRFPEMPATLKMDEGVFRKPRSGVRETDKEVVVSVEMPGARKENVQIKIEGLNLIIDAQVKSGDKTERKGFFSSSSVYRGFRNIIRLPCEVLKDKSSATYEHGVLKIVLPKKQVSDRPSDIPIE